MSTRAAVQTGDLATPGDAVASAAAFADHDGMDCVLHPLPLADVLPADDLAGWPAVAASLRQRLLAWAGVHGRRDLPWAVDDPYARLVSEVMLQQTPVATVRRRYPLWMARFPDAAHLAAADPDAVMAAWNGLGYALRAKRLQTAAGILVARGMPRDRRGRLALPGVGPSTASALGAFLFGAREALFDGNVARIWARRMGWPARTLSERCRLWSLAQHVTETLETTQMGAWTQAQMDLGATVCTPRRPQCEACPWQDDCVARLTRTITDSGRARRPAHRTVLVWGWQTDAVGAVLVRRTEGFWSDQWTPPALDASSWPPGWAANAERWRDGEAEAWPPADSLGGGVAVLTGRQVAWAITRARVTGTVVPWSRMGDLPMPTPLRAWMGLADATAP